MNQDSGQLQVGGPGQATSHEDRSVLNLIVNNAWILVTDAHGARSGRDVATGQDFIQEIPRSKAYVDRIDDAVTGEPATSFTMSVDISQPAEGAYRLVITGQGTGTSTLMVAVFRSDGSMQPVKRVPVPADKGSRTEFRLDVRNAAGSSSQLTQVEPGGSR